MRFVLTVAIVLAIAPGAAAAGSDSLLSGYGGPGDGEQALLGQTLLRDSASGGGGAPVASAPSPPAPGPEEIYETAPAATGAVPARDTGKAKPQTRPTPSTVPPSAVPRRPAATTSVLGTGGEPASASVFSGRDLALMVAVLIALAVLAACARWLAVGAARAARPV